MCLCCLAAGPCAGVSCRVVSCALTTLKPTTSTSPARRINIPLSHYFLCFTYSLLLRVLATTTTTTNTPIPRLSTPNPAVCKPLTLVAALCSTRKHIPLLTSALSSQQPDRSARPAT